MNLFGRHWTFVQVVALGLGLVMVGVVLALTYGSYVARGYDRPAVTILGAGDDLSVLVTDGPARLLVANGDNPAQFGNALSAAQPIGRSRIDILLLIGSTNDVTFLTRARNAVNARHTEVIGPPTLPAALGLPADSLMENPRRYQLSDDTSITVEVNASSDGDSRSKLSWRILVEHESTRVAVLSDGDVVSQFPDPGVVTALVVGGTNPLSALNQLQPLVVVRSGSVSGDDLREAVATDVSDRIWTYRVFGGDAKKFVFTDGGLSLPSGGVEVEASPQSN